VVVVVVVVRASLSEHKYSCYGLSPCSSVGQLGLCVFVYVSVGQSVGESVHKVFCGKMAE